MNKEWSELNKKVQFEIDNKDRFNLGIDLLIDLRKELFNVVESFFESLDKADFSAMPFINATWYHNKTIAYSIWHIFRIEDIVVHSLIKQDDELFFIGDYQKRINSDIITTGNELYKHEIEEFSQRLDLKELFSYACDVRESTDKIIRNLTFDDLRRKIPKDRKEYLSSLNVVSSDDRAFWLIDYWCKKDVRGLIRMPLSRHWIMHIEACLRIKNKLNKKTII